MLAQLNDCTGGLLHLGPNAITFRTLLHLGPNVITFWTLLHLGQLLHLGLQQSQLRTFQHFYYVKKIKVITLATYPRKKDFNPYLRPVSLSNSI